MQDTLSVQNGTISLRVAEPDEDLSTNFDKHMVLRAKTIINDNSTFLSRGDAEGGSMILQADQIKILNGATVEAGVLRDFFSPDIPSQTGQILIKADTLEMNGKGNLTRIFAEVTPVTAGADVVISADQVDILDGAQISTRTVFMSDGSSITINSRNLNIDRNGAKRFTGISAESSGIEDNTGRGGSINITAMEEVNVANGAEISTSTTGVGDAGELTIQANKLSINSNSQVSASTSGDIENLGAAGNIMIDTEFMEIRDGGILSTSADAVADSGRIEIRSGQLVINNGGAINAVNRSSNIAGEITIDVDTLAIDGQGSTQFTGITSETLAQINDTFGASNNITLEANVIDIVNGGQITNTNSGQFEGGNIDISASERLRIDGQSGQASTGILAESNGAAPSISGGDIIIRAADIQIANQGFISADTSGSGNGGNIIINSDSLVLSNNSVIQSNSDTGNAGNITINQTDRTILSRDSRIFVVLENNSRILAQAIAGSGGNINIITDALIRSSNSVINASSSIEIDALDIDIDNELAELPSNFLDASQWATVPCNYKSGNQVSRFIVAGRDGAFSSPGDLAITGLLFNINDIKSMAFRHSEATGSMNTELLNIDFDKLTLGSCES